MSPQGKGPASTGPAPQSRLSVLGRPAAPPLRPQVEGQPRLRQAHRSQEGRIATSVPAEHLARWRLQEPPEEQQGRGRQTGATCHRLCVPNPQPCEHLTLRSDPALRQSSQCPRQAAQETPFSPKDGLALNWDSSARGEGYVCNSGARGALSLSQRQHFST